MKIRNCKIVESKTIFWPKDRETTIRLKLLNAEGDYERIFSVGHPAANKLFRFAGVTNFSELEGKVIREVRDGDNIAVGFGDPIEDEFFLIACPDDSYTEEELMKTNL